MNKSTTLVREEKIRNCKQVRQIEQRNDRRSVRFDLRKMTCNRKGAQA